LDKRNLKNYLSSLDDSMNYELVEFNGYGSRKQGLTIEESEMDPGMPDSALFHINQIVQKEPRLKYFPLIVFNTLYSLLKIDLLKAYEYAKNVLAKNEYTDEPPSSSIINAIEACSYRYRLTPDIYRLGAEAYEAEINQYTYPELINIPKHYHETAWWYWLAKNKTKAVEAEQAAIDILKSRESILPSELSLYNTQLELYKTCSVED
jgi:hypothetical protein